MKYEEINSYLRNGVLWMQLWIKFVVSRIKCSAKLRIFVFQLHTVFYNFNVVLIQEYLNITPENKIMVCQKANAMNYHKNHNHTHAKHKKILQRQRVIVYATVLRYTFSKLKHLVNFLSTSILTWYKRIIYTKMSTRSFIKLSRNSRIVHDSANLVC